MSQLSGNVTLDDIAPDPPPLHKQLFGSAEALYPGLVVLLDTALKRDDAYHLVAGFFVEALLKSVLARAGASEKQLKDQYGHSLVRLWPDAAKNLLLNAPTPQWVLELDGWHDRPFLLRYKKDVALYSLPSKSLVQRELHQLLNIARGYVCP